MDIAIIRGPFLNEFEMQSYEPLIKHHNITTYHVNDNFFNVEDINLPKKKLRSLESLLGSYMGGLWRLPLHLAGYCYHMIGLEKELELMDVAHTVETFNAFSYQAVKAKRKCDIKVVTTQWENIPLSHEYLPLSKHIKNVVRKNTDQFIAITEQAKNALVLEGVPEKKIVVIPAGVDLSRFKPSEKDELYSSKLGLSENDFVILFVGRLTWEKGVYDLIRVHKRLIEDQDLNGDEIKLIIVGKGPAERNLAQLICKLKTSKNVKLTGPCAYAKMHEVHSIADVFVLPSIPTKHWQEQFGMALVEAMACEKPVVSTVCGSIPEVLGNAGELTEPSNPTLLCRKIKELIVNKTKRTELGKLARKRAEEKYDAKVIANKLKEVYEGLCSR